MKYIKELLGYLKSISESLQLNVKNQLDILSKMDSKITGVGNLIYGSSGNLSWVDVIDDKLVEDSRDEGTMVMREKAVKVITVKGCGTQEISFTRDSQLTKEEKVHYKKHGVVVLTVF